MGKSIISISKKLRVKTWVGLSVFVFLFYFLNKTTIKSQKIEALHTAPTSQDAPTRITVRIKKCHDGDTCRIETQDGMSFAVRLAGIDAPEVSPRKGCGLAQPGGVEAQQYLWSLVKEKALQLKQLDLDRYNRPIVEIYDGAQNLNLSLVAAGFAEVYREASPHKIDLKPYLAAEEQAKNSGLGIWSKSPQKWTYESPKNFRARGVNKVCRR